MGKGFILGVDPRDNLRPILFLKKSDGSLHEAVGVLTLDPKAANYGLCSFGPYFD